ncbi:hypothetical protein PENSPDRAFT_646011 [Peniophora sp. CONT]|nr:hypothetical protein PENSPDRAFT_646011 [Peniophora sp. CONT]
MYPDIQRCKTQFTWGHNQNSEVVFIVNYYQSRNGAALIVPPPDYLFATKLIGDTYTHHPTNEPAQIWFRDVDYHWTPAASGEKHPYLSPSGNTYERYVVNVREDGYATWIMKATRNGYVARQAREDTRASQNFVAGFQAGQSDVTGGQTAGSQAAPDAPGWRLFW